MNSVNTTTKPGKTSKEYSVGSRSWHEHFL
jgi:hypothetical protein